MNNQPVAKPISLKGAVMLLGSLYWEGNDAAQDGDKGARRKQWRDTVLDMNTCRDLPGIPIRYGRLSASRNGEFTIVFGGKPDGVAKIADLQSSLPVENHALAGAAAETLKQQVEALAKAEGIWSEKNKRHYTSWGLVAIAINPNSEFQEHLRKVWMAHFQVALKPSEYGEGVLDASGILQFLLGDDVWRGLDYCLATPTKPSCPVPSAKQIGEAVKLGSYFRRTYESGIKTPDDAEIRKYLAETLDSGAVSLRATRAAKPLARS